MRNVTEVGSGDFIQGTDGQMRKIREIVPVRAEGRLVDWTVVTEDGKHLGPSQVDSYHKEGDPEVAPRRPLPSWF